MADKRADKRKKAKSDTAQALDLAAFIDASPSPYHAVATIAARLQDAGFTALAEADPWTLARGDKHYVIRQDSSIIAFVVGEAPVAEAGFRMLGAHTDSPCLKVKPRPDVQKAGYLQLGVEVYGGAIIATWLDRDLGVAGRATVRKKNTLDTLLCMTDAPLLRVPNLAIHLNRKVNEEGLKPNPQTHLLPVLGISVTGEESSHERLLALLLGKKASDVADFNLCLFDTQKATLGGLDDAFIFSARLDNLASCHAGCSALIATAERKAPYTRVLACFDHEEVGSSSAQGAAGPFLRQTLERLAVHDGDAQALHRALHQSFCVSADMAHGVHPNYVELHEPEHLPKLGAGPDIKTNNSQRYATSGASAARFNQWCDEAGVTAQRFVVRNDMACGSTIGPITAAELGVTTVDVGNPMLSMHSIREMAASADVAAMINVLTRYWR